mmetsp:Transcript_132022/g.312902  ORF Transcript_132022/g.312902 Transcript_132022/m.312902 type:complete len:264 (+) Transcript_132022:25-816(+)
MTASRHLNSPDNQRQHHDHCQKEKHGVVSIAVGVVLAFHGLVNLTRGDAQDLESCHEILQLLLLKLLNVVRDIPADTLEQAVVAHLGFGKRLGQGDDLLRPEVFEDVDGHLCHSLVHGVNVDLGLGISQGQVADDVGCGQRMLQNVHGTSFRHLLKEPFVALLGQSKGVEEHREVHRLELLELEDGLLCSLLEEFLVNEATLCHCPCSVRDLLRLEVLHLALHLVSRCSQQSLVGEARPGKSPKRHGEVDRLERIQAHQDSIR